MDYRRLSESKAVRFPHCLATSSGLGAVLLCACLLVCFPRSASAQIIDVTLDPSQTQIHFTLGATMHTVHGTFRLKSGALEFSAATQKAEGAIVVDATSGQSGNTSRDRKMHEAVLKSAEYAQIIFVPQQIEGPISLDGDSHVQIQGLIQMLGAQHPVTVPVETHISGGKLRATLNLSIPYVQWGLKDPSTFLLRVDKSVKIEVQAVGTVATVRE